MQTTEATLQEKLDTLTSRQAQIGAERLAAHAELGAAREAALSGNGTTQAVQDAQTNVNAVEHLHAEIGQRVEVARAALASHQAEAAKAAKLVELEARAKVVRQDTARLYELVQSIPATLENSLTELFDLVDSVRSAARDIDEQAQSIGVPALLPGLSTASDLQNQYLTQLGDGRHPAGAQLFVLARIYATQRRWNKEADWEARYGSQAG